MIEHSATNRALFAQHVACIHATNSQMQSKQSERYDWLATGNRHRIPGVTKILCPLLTSRSILHRYILSGILEFLAPTLYFCCVSTARHCARALILVTRRRPSFGAREYSCHAVRQISNHCFLFHVCHSSFEYLRSDS